MPPPLIAAISFMRRMYSFCVMVTGASVGAIASNAML